MRNKNNVYRLLIVIGLVLCGVGAFKVGLFSFLSLSYVVDHIEILKNSISHNYVPSVLYFIGIYSLVTACALPGCSILLTISGLLFNTVPGLVFALAGSIMGSLLLFLWVRYVAGSWFQHKYAARLERFNGAVAQHGYHYLLLMRLTTLLPFNVITILSALTLIPLGTFLGASLLGSLPTALLYSYAGSQLYDIASHQVINPEFMSSWWLVSLPIVLRIGVLPFFIKKITRYHRKK